MAGAGSGVTATVLFNPIDRALHLAMKEGISLSKLGRLGNPFHGALAGSYSKLMSNGGYFVLQNEYDVSAPDAIKQSKLVKGAAIGSILAFFTAVPNAVRYRMWGMADAQFMVTALQIFEYGGIKALCRGANETAVRDICFGATYEVMREKAADLASAPDTGWMCFGSNLAGGMFAAVASSLPNYVRNQKLGTPPSETPLSSVQYLRLLWVNNTLREIPHRLMLGPGVLRVAVGMALCQFCFDRVLRMLNDIDNQAHQDDAAVQLYPRAKH